MDPRGLFRAESLAPSPEVYLALDRFWSTLTTLLELAGVIEEHDTPRILHILTRVGGTSILDCLGRSLPREIVRGFVCRCANADPERAARLLEAAAQGRFWRAVHDHLADNPACHDELWSIGTLRRLITEGRDVAPYGAGVHALNVLAAAVEGLVRADILWHDVPTS